MFCTTVGDARVRAKVCIGAQSGEWAPRMALNLCTLGEPWPQKTRVLCGVCGSSCARARIEDIQARVEAVQDQVVTEFNQLETRECPHAKGT